MRAILLFLSLFAVAPALAADKDKIVGTRKLTSAIYEELASKERGKILGDNPRGYQIATPDRWISIVATEKRPVPKTDEERVLAYRTLISYSGRYRIKAARSPRRWMFRLERILGGSRPGTLCAFRG